MIQLEGLWKIYGSGWRRKTVARDINAVFPTGVSVGLLGRNGAGKSSLLKMIAGTLDPTAGRVASDGTISWPVGFSGSFHQELTGAQNTRFIARVYGVDTDALADFVEEFADLGGHFHMPFRTYSSGMRSRLAFGASMGIRFDTYLVDETTAVGDADFKAKSQRVFDARMAESGAIVVSHSIATLKGMCEAGAVLEDGELSYYEDIDDAVAHYHHLIASRKQA